MMAERVRLASVHDRATARALLTEAEAEARAAGKRPGRRGHGLGNGRPALRGRLHGLREAEQGWPPATARLRAAAGTALERARDLGSTWLVSELESLAASARLPLDGGGAGGPQALQGGPLRAHGA